MLWRVAGQVKLGFPVTRQPITNSLQFGVLRLGFFHRFGGKEFRFGSAEVGHIHAGGIVDIPFPRSVRDALLAEGLAEEHRWVPNSGWITFHICSEEDLKRALWLMRLSYLRYTLKTAADC